MLHRMCIVHVHRAMCITLALAEQIHEHCGTA